MYKNIYRIVALAGMLTTIHGNELKVFGFLLLSANIRIVS